MTPDNEEKRTVPKTNHYVHPEGMTWPHPEDPERVEWQLRYGDAEAVRRVAASYVAAYRSLVDAAPHRRDELVRAIRAAAGTTDLSDGR